MAALATHHVSSAPPVAVVPDSLSPLSLSAHPSSTPLHQTESTNNNNLQK